MPHTKFHSHATLNWTPTGSHERVSGLLQLDKLARSICTALAADMATHVPQVAKQIMREQAENTVKIGVQSVAQIQRDVQSIAATIAATGADIGMDEGFWQHRYSEQEQRADRKIRKPGEYGSRAVLLTTSFRLGEILYKAGFRTGASTFDTKNNHHEISQKLEAAVSPSVEQLRARYDEEYAKLMVSTGIWVSAKELTVEEEAALIVEEAEKRAGGPKV